MGKVIKVKPKDMATSLTEAPETRRAIIRLAHKIKSRLNSSVVIPIE